MAGENRMWKHLSEVVAVIVGDGGRRWIWKSSGGVAVVSEIADLKSDRGEVVVSEIADLENRKVDMEIGGGAEVVPELTVGLVRKEDD
ncbi:hypothetical protein Tco_0007155 [Tanacetum coccineum]